MALVETTTTRLTATRQSVVSNNTGLYSVRITRSDTVVLSFRASREYAEA